MTGFHQKRLLQISQWLEKHRKNATEYNNLWKNFFEKYNFDANLIELSDVLAYLGEIGRLW